MRELRSIAPPAQDEGQARPFVKWAGGKRSVISELRKRVPERFERYHEPFLGGGSFFFALGRRAGKAFLSDINDELITTYRVIQKSPGALIASLRRHERNHSPDYYLRVRSEQSLANPIDRASRFIYLNKTCFNGLYRVNRSGLFNVPMGHYANPKICDEENIIEVHGALKGMNLRVCCFTKIKIYRNSFIYCDPPYHEAFTNYISRGFRKENQEALRDCADKWRRNGALVMISNSDTKFIRDLYRGYNLHRISAPRQISCRADGRSSVSELLITSY